jgi:hypothetical protein
METSMMLHGFASYLGIAVAGLIATSVMTLFALSFSGVGLISANAIEAVGSSVLGKLDGARSVGVWFHGIAGMAFAFVYAFLIQAVHLTGAAWPMIAGGFIGGIHGYLVSFVVVISIGEYSHYAQFRENGIGLGLIYLAAHVLYGTTLGFLFYALHVFA